MVDVWDKAQKSMQDKSVWDLATESDVEPLEFNMEDVPEDIRSNAERMRNALYYAQQMNLDPDLAYELEPQITDDLDRVNVKEATKSLLGQTAKAWQRGGEHVDVDFLWAAVYRGEISREEAEAQTKEFEQKWTKDPLEARNWLESLWMKTVAIAHPMAAGTMKGVTYGTITGSAAIALGQAGPQIAIPEEVVTAPSAYAIGHTYGTLSYWSEQGIGSIYKACLDAGVSQKTAERVASIGGPLYGAIEFSQVDRLIPGLRNAKKGIINTLLHYLKNVVVEVGEEAEQKIVTEGAQLVGELIDAKVEAANVPERLKEIGIKSLQEAKEAVGPMALLLAPTTAVGITVAVSEKAKAKPPMPEEIIRVAKELEESLNLDAAEARRVARKKLEYEAERKAATEAEKAPEKQEGFWDAYRAIQAMEQAEKVVAPETDLIKQIDAAFVAKDAVKMQELIQQLPRGSAVWERASNLWVDMTRQPTPEAKAVAPKISKEVIISEPEVTPQERVSMEDLEARVEREEDMYYMERVKGEGFVIKETATGKEKVVIAKRKAAQQRLVELNEQAKPIQPTRRVPKIITPEVIDELVPEPIALKASLKKAAQAGRIAYQAGAAESTATAKAKIKDIRLAEQFRVAQKLEALNIIRTFVPKDQRWRYMRRAIVATTPANVEKLTGQIQTAIEKAERKQLERDFRKYVHHVRAKYKGGKIALGQLPSVVRERIEGLLADVDLAKLSEAKAEELARRQKWYTKTAATLAEGFESLEREQDIEATNALVIRKGLIEELRRLAQTPVSEMDTEQIQTIFNAIKELVYYTEAKGEINKRRHLEKLHGQLVSARTEVVPAKKMTQLVEAAGFVRYMFIEGAAQLRTLINRVTGQENSGTRELLWDALVRSNRRRKVALKQIAMAWNKELAKADIKVSDLPWDRKVKIVLGKKPVEITLEDLLSIYAHSQADDNLSQLLKTEGLNIRTRTRWSETPYRVGTPTLEELRQVAKKLPDKMKKLVEIHFRVNRQVTAPLLNETSMKMYNYDIATWEKYYHISREYDRHGVYGQVFSESEFSQAMEEQGRYRWRTGGKQRINIRPFRSEVMQGIQQDAFFHAMALDMANARTLISDSRWRKAMKDAGRSKELSVITRMIGRIQVHSSDQSIVDRLSMKLLSKTGKSILGLRLSGGAVQVASLPVAHNVIPAKYFRGTSIGSAQEYQELMDKDATLWLRYIGKQYDYAAGINSSANAFEAMLFQHALPTDKFLAPYTRGDQIAIYKIYQAAENYIEDTTNLKRGTPAFDEAVVNIFDRAMETQPMWEVMYRTDLTSSPSAWTRTFTLFMSARIAQHNQLLQAHDDLVKGRISSTEALNKAKNVGIANFYVSLFRNAVKRMIKYGGIALFTMIGFRPPPDEEEIKNEAENLAKRLPQETVFNLIGLNPLGQLISSVAYNTIRTVKWDTTEIQPGRLRTGNMLADILLDVYETGGNVALFVKWGLQPNEVWQSGPDKGEPKYLRYGARAATDIATLLSYMYGLPFEGLESDVYYQLKLAMKSDSQNGKKQIPQKRIP